MLHEFYEAEGQQLTSKQNVRLLDPFLEEMDPVLKEHISNASVNAPQTAVSFANSTNYGVQQGTGSGTVTNNFGYKRPGFT